MDLWKYHKTSLLLISFSLIFYVLFAYDLNREDGLKLLSLYFGLFVLAYLLIKQCSDFKLLVAASVLFRLIFLFAEPNLSQDFYRFIWDGRLLLEGMNPYVYLPISFFQEGSFPIYQGLELYKGMGALSASNYTNYPPINQLCFFIAALISGKHILGSILVLRLIIITADIGIIYLGKKLLEALNLPKSRIFLYALNPLIIIELTGNLHFEGVMLFFLVWSLYLLQKGKWQCAAVVFALSIGTKLITLMLLPLFFKYIKKLENNTNKLKGLKTVISFYSLVGLTIISLYVPFLSFQFLENYTSSIGLWFGQFEFNASLYYIARAFGYWFTGFNLISTISPVLSILTFLSILGLALFRRNYTTQQLITSMLFATSVYFFLSTTVHPWYISTLVVLCVFNNYRYPIVWSLCIVLSYLAYSNENFKENLWIVGMEYLIVFTVLLYELNKKKTARELAA
ncbi:mannosyltransferase [uncultured Winogradskyella sp.]|uniref:mannosyltransferase n=1 Tax=uncultured Winogradskyella sp. TaxID=395353 RepID=UPI003516DD40